MINRKIIDKRENHEAFCYLFIFGKIVGFFFSTGHTRDEPRELALLFSILNYLHPSCFIINIYYVNNNNLQSVYFPHKKKLISNSFKFSKEKVFFSFFNKNYLNKIENKLSIGRHI